MNRAIFGIAAVFVVCFVMPATATATAQEQSKPQQACINALNKAGAKVAATQGKESTACIKNAGKGKEDAAQTCLSADTKLKVNKAKDKTTDADTKKCAAESPDFGRATVDAINTAAIDEEVALTGDVFGSDLTAAIILTSSSKEAAACQAAISKAYEKLAATKMKSFLKCKKAGLKDGTAISTANLEDCVAALDNDSKVARAAQKIADAHAKRCGDVDVDAAFPGDCISAVDFSMCVDERVECRVCLMLNAMDNLAVDCDLFDNGAADLSCPPLTLPTTTTTTTTTSTTTTTLCVPDCVGKNCGPDGCGGICGTCGGPPEFCNAGACDLACEYSFLCDGGCPGGGSCAFDLSGCVCPTSECSDPGGIGLCNGSCSVSGGACGCGGAGFCVSSGDCDPVTQTGCPPGFLCGGTSVGTGCLGPSCSFTSDCSAGVCICQSGCTCE